MVDNDKCLPKITLYTDNTFKFIGNYYAYMETLYGTFEAYRGGLYGEYGDYTVEYLFVVSSDVPEYIGYRKPSFTIIHNELTGEVIFNTSSADALGMTGDFLEYPFSAE